MSTDISAGVEVAEAPQKSEWEMRSERIEPIVRFVCERAAAALTLEIDAWQSLAAEGDEGKALFRQEIDERATALYLGVLAKALSEAAKVTANTLHGARLQGHEDRQEIARRIQQSLVYKTSQAVAQACVNRGDRYYPY